MNANSSKVSIVLPTYNGAGHVRQSIDSCLNQTYKNIELIIVDDGSTDETPEVVKSYTDKRMKYIRHKKNEGLPYALNTGFANATGEYLTWTSDDNQYLPKAIEEMTFCLAKNKDVDLVYADYWAHYLETGDKELRRMPDDLDLAEQNGVGACFLYTRRAYKKIGDYNPKYQLVEDYDYWIRICKSFKAIHYPQPLYIYGEHSKSLKSTRHLGIMQFEIILKYKNGYISMPELSESFLKSFYESPHATEPSVTFSPKNVLLYLQNIRKISRLSLPLCLICLSLLLRLSVSAILKFYIRHLLLYPLAYADFFFSFKPKCSNYKSIKDRKNVLCIAQYMVVGGAEKVILNIAEETDSKKFSFHIITTLPANNVWRNKFETHFQNIFAPTKKIKNTYYNKARYNLYFNHLIKKLDIDIVLLSNSMIGYEYLPKLKSKFWNVKTVDVLHAEDYPPPNLIKWSAPFIDRRICISQHLKDYFVKRYRKSGIDEKYIERLKVIYNGIDTREYNTEAQTKGRFKSRFSIPDKVKVISLIGRFSNEKNPLLFVEIAKNVVTTLPNELKFVMAGDGPEFDKVKSLIKNYGLEGNFILTGMIDNVAELLNDTYVLLIVSKKEGIPLVILEAMAMGVPVISTNIGAINEVVKNNVNGYLINVESNVVESFTYKILDLVTGKANYHELAEKARETIIPRFTLETMGARYQNVFDELSENHDLT